MNNGELYSYKVDMKSVNIASPIPSTDRPRPGASPGPVSPRGSIGTTSMPICRGTPRPLQSGTPRSPKQRDAPERQVAFQQARYPGECIRDIGGGLNGKRKGLVTLRERLRGGAKLRVVVAHRDRLARIGFNLVAYLIEAHGGEGAVLRHTDHSPEQELTEDRLAILHTFSCRMPGLRRYRREIQEDPDLP